jgi:hypothetical protein
VDEEVVEAGRRDRIAEGLERRSMVARRELELLEGDLGGLAEWHSAKLVQAAVR